jgi:hypothetical protein
MPKQKTDDLIQLIRSLTRSEKKHFRLFVRRNQISDEILFLHLFDYLEKNQAFVEKDILAKVPGIKKSQLSNLKAHLYKQLLTSIRLLNTANTPEIQIRDLIDFAKVLYDKGMYRQSLNLLEKAKVKAYKANLYAVIMEIVDFEKHLESQYITRSIEGRAELLAKESMEVHQLFHSTSLFSNLALRLYGHYVKNGYVKTENDLAYLQEVFSTHLPDIRFESLELIGKIYYHQSYLWFYHMAQDFPRCYKHASHWVELFLQHPDLIKYHPSIYLKGLHNLLSTVFNLGNHQKFVEGLQLLLNFQNGEISRLNRNIEGLTVQYVYIHQINLHYFEGTFSKGLTLIQPLFQLLKENKYSWDNRRIMVFYYRMACLYFGSGDYHHTIDFLNKIIHAKNPDYRSDIYCFARILSLIAHYELGNDQLLEYQIKSVYRFLIKMEELGEVHREILNFLKKTPLMQKRELKNQFNELKAKLEILLKHPFERRSFLYLDIISWLESKIEQRYVEEIIQNKFNLRRKNQIEQNKLERTQLK